MEKNHGKNWAVLKYPNVRAELMEFLRECCDLHHYLIREEVETDIHFFFDDHDFADDPIRMIGEVLFSEQEANCLTEFVRTYEKAIGPGKELPPIATVDWAPVANAATKAYQLILQADQPSA